MVRKRLRIFTEDRLWGHLWQEKILGLHLEIKEEIPKN